jgi:hypothetical protein
MIRGIMVKTITSMQHFSLEQNGYICLLISSVFAFAFLLGSDV